MTELDSCPFCGSENVFLVNTPARTNGYWVLCKSCSAEGSHAASGETATHLWNEVLRKAPPVLKECPFCGSDGEYITVAEYDDGTLSLRCNVCGVSTRHTRLRTEAVEDWNKRAKE